MFDMIGAESVTSEVFSDRLVLTYTSLYVVSTKQLYVVCVDSTDVSGNLQKRLPV